MRGRESARDDTIGVTVPRGADPEDAEDFANGVHPALRTAVAELSWLLDRGYAEPSALALVGNRHELRRRQREAVRRSACGDGLLARRRAGRVEVASVVERGLAIDGFNRLITLEAALAGAPIFRGRDGLVRDIASVHGSWRHVDTTAEAIDRLAAAIDAIAPAHVIWYLDRPVSQSGKLAALLAATRAAWRVEVVADPDRVLRACPEVVATADAGILDAGAAWFELLERVLAELPATWSIDLGA